MRINDARPMWVTPSQVYATQSAPGLERYVKVVGRNLQSAPGASTRIRFTGPETFTLVATAEARGRFGRCRIDRYVARATLPARLRPGRYSIDVSRDGRSWVPLEDQQWVVLPADLRRRSGVQAGRLRARRRCRRYRFASLLRNSRGFGRGRRIGRYRTGQMGPDRAAARKARALAMASRSRRASTCGEPHPAHCAGTIDGTSRRPHRYSRCSGATVVSGITFVDERVFHAGDEPQPAPCNWGERTIGSIAPIPRALRTEDVTITDNVFDKPYAGSRRWRPAHPPAHDHAQRARRLPRKASSWGQWLQHAGSLRHRRRDHHAHTSFRPGGYFDPRIGQGAMASESAHPAAWISAKHRGWHVARCAVFAARSARLARRLLLAHSWTTRNRCSSRRTWRRARATSSAATSMAADVTCPVNADLVAMTSRTSRCQRRPAIHVESVRRSDGIPGAVYLHGGPGSGCQPDHRRLIRSAALSHRSVRSARRRPQRPKANARRTRCRI